MNAEELNKSINDIREENKKLTAIYDDDDKIFEYLNNLEDDRIDELLELYGTSTKLINQASKKARAANIVRYITLRQLKKGNKITSDSIEKIKQSFINKDSEFFEPYLNKSIIEKINEHPKGVDPFAKLWNKSFRLLHPFLISPKDFWQMIKQITASLMKDLELPGYMSKEFDFTGAQQEGTPYAWFVIFPEKLKSHKNSYRFTCMFEDGEVKVYLDAGPEIEKDNNKSKTERAICQNYQDMLSNFKRWKEELLSLNESLIKPNKLTQKASREVSYWAVGSEWGGEEQEERFIDEGIWEDGHGVDGNEQYKKILEQVNIGDYLLLKSSYAKGANRSNAVTKLKRIGRVKEINEYYSFNVEWLSFEVLPREFEGVMYKDTIMKIDDGEILSFVKNLLDKKTDKTPNDIPLNQILYGPPGTGKTYNTIIKALQIIGGNEAEELLENYKTDDGVYKSLLELYNDYRKKGRIQFITFHQNYSYEEFVEGISPKLDSEKETIFYTLAKGPLKEIKEKAEKDLNNNYVLIIDEINRGNISKILGEMITLLEEDKRYGNDYAISMPLMYSKDEFSLPKNLYIIGTMNTADKSIALVDVALRRRFSFIEMMPKPELLEENIEGVRLQSVFKALNKKIMILLDRDHQIGHSYFMNIKNLKQLKHIWFREILPLLNEYFYGDWEKLNLLLSGGFITKVQEESLKDFIEETWTFKEERSMDDAQFISEINNIAV